MAEKWGSWFFTPKAIFLSIFFLLWLMYALQTRWATRLYVDVFSKFVGFVAFQYNKGFRQKFIETFELHELPKDLENLNQKEKRVVIQGNIDESVGPDHTFGLKYPADHHIKMAQMVSYSIDKFLMMHKKMSYNISRSYSNEVAQRLNYYLHEYQEDVIKDNAVFKMINVDYYADMEYWLTFMKPVIMYTFVPEGVGGQLSNGSFSCKNDIWNIVRADGSGCEHYLWDYGYEYCTIETCWGVVICPIEQFRMPEEPHYRIVCIIPATYVPVPFSMLVKRRRLDRLKVTYLPMNLLRFVDVTGRELLAMAPMGSSVDYVVPSDLFDILNMRHTVLRCRLKTLEQFLRQEGVPKEYICSTLINEIFRYRMYPPAEERMPRVPMCEDVRYAVKKPLPLRIPRLVLKPQPKSLKDSKEKFLTAPKHNATKQRPSYHSSRTSRSFTIVTR